MKKLILTLFFPIFIMPTFPKFPPCFPFCLTNTPSSTPTVTLHPTPTLQVSPTQPLQPSATPTPTAGQSGTIDWGAYVASQPYNLNDINKFETDAGKHMTIIHWYQSFGVTDGTQNFMKAWMDTVTNHGAYPMITLESWDYTQGINQPKYRLANITNGNFDTYLTKFATDAKAWGKPFYFRFDHEMNGNWYPWSEQVNGNATGDYVKAWKHVHDIFTQVGANNVSWVWCPNVAFPTSIPVQGLYPGDSYTDWVCMDGYNWGNTNGGWQSFTLLFTSTYNQFTLLTSKPIMIGETSSAEVGGSKAQWITDALGGGIDALPKVKAILWFNQNNPPDWRIESSLSSQNAFKAAIGNAKYK